MDNVVTQKEERIFRGGIFLLFGKVLVEIPTSSLVLPSPSQKHILYEGSPFSTLSDSSKGFLFEYLAMEVWRMKFGRICLPTYHKGEPKRMYDFHYETNQRKIEVKSSSLICNKVTWQFQFKHVKLRNFDNLILVCYFPKKVEMYLWDGQTGFINRKPNVAESEGHSIVISAKISDSGFMVRKEPGIKFFDRYFYN